MHDARRFHRRPVDLCATITVDGGAPEACRIENLSVGGAFVALRRLPNGARIRVAFGLATLGEPVDSAATVMWSDGARIGVRFDGLRARETWALCRYFDALDGGDLPAPLPA